MVLIIVFPGARHGIAWRLVFVVLVNLFHIILQCGSTLSSGSEYSEVIFMLACHELVLIMSRNVWYPFRSLFHA